MVCGVNPRAGQAVIAAVAGKECPLASREPEAMWL